MKSQATKCTQQELAYLAYWQARGAKFGRDEKIPTSTCTPPCNRTDKRDLVWSAAGIAVIVLVCWFNF